jgi:sugar phosphate isomerase/epimerase
MSASLSRRKFVTSSGGALLATGLPRGAATATHASPGAFRYSLNTSTIRSQNLPITEAVEIAARAGYDAIEPWIDELERLEKSGGSLRDLGRRIRDRGLAVESSIGFYEWIVDDEPRRKHALEGARRAMERLQQIGGRRLAAPPAGATDRADMPPERIAERYRALLEIGDGLGVVPELEHWGFSKTVRRLGDAAQIAALADHPRACILPDVFHLYKGGSGFNGLRLLSAGAIHAIHVNDYPAAPPVDQITDAARVYPGEGVAPLELVFRQLREIGFNGVLSLELFNPAYWKQDAFTVAKTGLEKMKAVVGRGARG